MLKELRACTPVVEKFYFTQGTARVNQKFRMCEISTSSEIKKIRAFFNEGKQDTFRYTSAERVRVWIFTAPEVNMVGKFTQNEMVVTCRKKKDDLKSKRKKIKIRPKRRISMKMKDSSNRKRGRRKIRIKGFKKRKNPSRKISPFGYSFRLKDQDNFVSIGDRARKGIDLSRTTAGFKMTKKKIEWVPSPKAEFWSDDEDNPNKRRHFKTKKSNQNSEKKRRVVIRSLKNSRMSVRLEVR